MKKITAVILSGGKSSRMNGPFKPLVPIGGIPALERSVRMFRNAGVDDILCVTGHHHSRLSGLLRKLQVREVFNRQYEEGMFSSVRTGVSGLDSDCSAFFILPVDIPLVRTTTVQRLMKAWNQGGKTVLYPVFKERRGHPPLIPAEYAGDIVNWQGNNGLRGFLEQHEHESMEIPVADAYMLMDMDTMEDYRRLTRGYHRYRIPTADECRTLITEVLGVDRRIIGHCRAVAEVAVTMGKAVNASGGDLDLDLVAAGDLLHDLARDQSHHASAGARLLRGMGFPAVADIVAAHMNLPARENAKGPVSEAEVVFLADKLVAGERRVSLDKRFGTAMKKYGDNPDAAEAIEKRHRDAANIQKKIGELINNDLSDAPW